MKDEQSSSDGSAEGASAEDMRASHADRDQVVEALRDAAAEGRLTSEELDERVGAALNARTLRDLAALTRDLPAPPADPTTQTKDLVKIDQRFGTVERLGPWTVPRRLEIKLTAGEVKLDFTDAVINHDQLEVDIDLGIGADLLMITKPGIVVVTDDVTVRMGDIKVRPGKQDPEVPVALRVVVSGRIRGGDLEARYPRRTIGQWVRGESAV